MAQTSLELLPHTPASWKTFALVAVMEWSLAQAVPSQWRMAAGMTSAGSKAMESVTAQTSFGALPQTPCSGRLSESELPRVIHAAPSQ
jgi:hypothetical protein